MSDFGWIKLHRRIKYNWIWDNPMYLKAWLCILLSVNHEDNKVLIDGELIDCKAGQSVMSLNGWTKEFGKGWTVQRTRTFIDLLKSDGMIVSEGLRKTTRVTVCKYVDYQITQQGDNKQTTNRQQRGNNKQEGIKNDREIIYNDFYDSEILKSENDQNYIKFINVLWGNNSTNTKMNSILSMPQQLTFDQFKNMMFYKQKYHINVTELLEAMENNKKLKDRKSLWLTFQTYMKTKYPQTTSK